MSCVGGGDGGTLPEPSGEASLASLRATLYMEWIVEGAEGVRCIRPRRVPKC